MKIFSFLSPNKGINQKKTEFTPDNNWLIVRRLSRPFTGDHFLLQNSQSGDLLLKKFFNLQSKEKTIQIQKSLEKRMQMNHENVIKMEDYDLEIDESWCSSFFFVSVFYEYPERLLSDHLSEQLNDVKPTPAPLMLKIFYNTVNGLQFLQENYKNYCSGYLQLRGIFYDPKSNNYKIIENLKKQTLTDFYFNMRATHDKFAIFSPETISTKSILTNQSDQYSKIDAFNLGLILLVLGTNCLPGYFYTKNFSGFDFKRLGSKIDAFLLAFDKDPLLCDILMDLLQIDIKSRLSIPEIKKKYPLNIKFKKYRSSNQRMSTGGKWSSKIFYKRIYFYLIL